MPQQPPAGPDIFGYRAPPPRRRSWAKTLVWILVVIGLMALAGWGLTLLAKSHTDAAAAAGGPGGGPGGPGGGGRGGRGGGGRGGMGGGAFTTVGTAKAEIGSIPITVDALGTVTPLNNVTIVPRVTGQLMNVDVHEGQLIKKGQRLALIDPRPYQAAVNQAAGQLAHDEALLANAKLDLKRYQALQAQDSIASQQVDTQVALVKQYEGTVVVDRAAVASAKLNLEYCTLVSPVNGLIGLRKVDPGALVQAGQSTGLFVITTLDPTDVTFALPEDELPQLQKRLNQGAKLPVTVFDRARVNQLAVGTFYSLDSGIDTSTGTVHAKARFEHFGGALFPNQFVNVRVLVDTLTNVVTVPTSAVRHGAPGDFVYTVTPDRTAHVKVVKLGPESGETIAIVSGLNVGETVVTEGGDRLRDGAKVMLPGDKPRFGAGGGSGRRGRRGGGQGAGDPDQAAQASGGQGAGGQAGAGEPGAQNASGAQNAQQGAAAGQGGQGHWQGGSGHPWNGQHHRRQQQGGADAGGEGQ